MVGGGSNNGRAFGERCSMRPQTSLPHQLRFACEIRPFLEILFDRGVELRGCVRIDEYGLVGEIFLDVVLHQYLIDIGAQRVDDILRQFGGSDHRHPQRHFESGQAGFGDRRHVRQIGDAPGRGDAERAELPALDIALGRGQDAELRIDAPREQIDDGLGRALIGNLVELDPSRCRKQFGASRAKLASPSDE